MSDLQFAIKLNTESTEIKDELCKQLITVSATMLIFLVALSQIISKNPHNLIPKELMWLCLVLSLFCGVGYQVARSYRLHKHSNQILDPKKIHLRQRGDASNYVLTTRPEWYEAWLQMIQIASFLIGVALTGLGLFA